MNLLKLYEMQRKLIEKIDYNERDRFDKTILALLVEVGECANEWRGFKYWSVRQSPTEPREEVKWINSKPHYVTKNPLLEEYVDGLHFVLQLGIELKLEHIKPYLLAKSDTLSTFQSVYKWTLDLSVYKEKTGFEMLLSEYLSLGYHLGFTEDDIYSAYMEKNEINHVRQNEGY